MTNKRNGALYTGVTSNLVKRVHQHKRGETQGFTKRYGCKLLVYFEVCDSMTSAINREKQIKAGRRSKKLELIESTNPEWEDLFEEII